MLFRIGNACARRHWLVIGLWVAAVVLLGVVEAGRNGQPVDRFTIPGTQSQQATDLLQRSFPAANGTSATAVFRAPGGSLRDPANQAAVTATVTALKAIPGVSSASSPFDPVPTGLAFDEGTPELQTADLAITADGTVGYSSVSFAQPLSGLAEATDLYAKLDQAVQPARTAGLQAELAGAVVDAGNPPPPGISEYSDLIGILCAVLILLIALGSATSMAVPIAVALVSVTTSHNIVNILMASFDIGTVAPILGSMIGLGVGIDYSLFIVSRYRQNLSEGASVDDAVGRALATSGSAVLFAGITVCIAMCGLFLVGIPYVAQLGFISALFVSVTVLAAMTLVPAILGALGPRIDALRIHKRDEHADVHKTLSARWANETSRHPIRFASISLLVLLAIASPAMKMELGFPDEGNLDPALTQQKAYTLLTQNFGPGVNGPLLLAVDLPDVSGDNALPILEAFAKLNGAVAATPGVARVSLPIPNNFPSAADPKAVPTAAIMQVVPTSAPNSEATAQMVRNLREQVIPSALAGSAIPPGNVYVGGQTAVLIDLTAAIQSKLPIFIGGVIAGAFVLLMMVFRSLFVPFKAALMNVLSIGGAYGVIVVVFQWGWGKDQIGLYTTVPVVAFVPVMMFAVLFGLSMDYEVFLISRIKEEYARSGDSRESVVMGLAATARVITAAALIMISVFLSFVFNPDPTVKMIGLGMAVAVFVDATIVRMMLVPSTMELAGKANWWLPRWLDKVLPHIHVE